jgi:hypothetical protein
MSPNAGGGMSRGVSANEYSCASTGAQIYFGDLSPYLTRVCAKDNFFLHQTISESFINIFTDMRIFNYKNFLVATALYCRTKKYGIKHKDTDRQVVIF